ncbi:MAG: DUF1800 domain-containing protein [Saprospiraceae bacterium]|nr:DUF1800 domain-containing protein [Saprospiraceae bacterium]
MDRRSTLQALFSGRVRQSRQRTHLTFSGGLDAYSGPWDAETAAHLLRRTTFGPTRAEIDEALNLGLEGTIQKLFEPQAPPSPPINHFYNQDPNVPVGETWIDAPYDAVLNFRAYRFQSLQGWTVGLLLESGMNIREVMTLFWHNHFVTSRIEVNDPKFLYVYISLLRSFATGNFRELTKNITIDPSMLRYLNGDQNTRTKPNENYARELLELFTIGKGPQAGPGDYTYYTEEDVLAMARVLTGWVTTGYNTLNPDIKVGSEYRNNRHDLGTKTLSHRFDNVDIPNMGDQEYAHLIDIIFSKSQCAVFIARKLYRWFVYYEITPETEAEVIQPMAQLILDHDYEIAPALQALLASQHFYDACLRGVMIKHPVCFVMRTLRQSGWVAPGNLNTQYRYWNLVFPTFGLMQMAYYDPPSVAGWKAWYQDPAWYQSWLNSVTLPIRTDWVRNQIFTGLKFGNNPNAPFPVLQWVGTLPDPYEADAMIEGFAELLFPQPVSAEKRAYLKEILLQGLPDYVWSVEYADYISDPSDMTVANSVANKLKNLLAAMMQMPEHQLC